MRLIYSLLWILALPLILLRLAWKARQDKRYLKHIGERLGHYAFRLNPPLIWVHTVSVGETRAAAPLVTELLQRYPHHHLLLTHMTPTGRETAAALFGHEPRVSSAYSPYDLPFFTHRFFRHFSPQLGILLETELWPNLIHSASAHGVPIALVNARLSERSLKRYQGIASGLIHQTLQKLRCVAAQSQKDADRLSRLGALHVQVTGNLKFDIPVSPEQLRLAEHFRETMPGRQLVLAGCTREGEEVLLLDAFLKKNWAPEVVLGVVPRHPQRFDAVIQLMRSRGLSFQKRSDNAPLLPTTQVWIGDTMGEMSAYYAASQCALIGGSWGEWGGHNLIEAAAVGTPSICGPHMFNFAEATRLAVEAGAAVQVNNLDEAFTVVASWLNDEAKRKAMGLAAHHFCDQHRGATRKTADLLRPFIQSVTPHEAT